jgi:hypothetical protein
LLLSDSQMFEAVDDYPEEVYRFPYDYEPPPLRRALDIVMAAAVGPNPRVPKQACAWSWPTAIATLEALWRR